MATVTLTLVFPIHDLDPDAASIYEAALDRLREGIYTVEIEED